MNINRPQTTGKMRVNYTVAASASGEYGAAALVGGGNTTANVNVSGGHPHRTTSTEPRSHHNGANYNTQQFYNSRASQKNIQLGTNKQQ